MKTLKVILGVIIAITLTLGLNAAWAGKDYKGENWKIKKSDNGIVIDIDFSSLGEALKGLKKLEFNLADMEKFEEKMEAWGERFEKDMERFGEKIEKDFEGLEKLSDLKGLKDIHISVKGLDFLESLPEIIESSLKGLECLKDLNVHIEFEGHKSKKK